MQRDAAEREHGTPLGFSNPINRTTYLLLGALVVAIVAGAFFTSHAKHPGAGPTTPRLAVGQPAPAFTTQDLDGKMVRLADYRGEPLLLNFWATWCTPCEEEMPAIQAAVARHRAQRLTVLAVNYRELDRIAIRSFLQKLHVTYRVALDPDAKIADSYGVTNGLPISVFVDASGRVAWIHIGEMQTADIEQGVGKALA